MEYVSIADRRALVSMWSHAILSSASICDHDPKIEGDIRSVFPYDRRPSQNFLRSATAIVCDFHTLGKLEIVDIPDRLGRTGTNPENRERFYFPDASPISAMVGVRRRWIRSLPIPWIAGLQLLITNCFLLAVETHRTITRRNGVRLAWGPGLYQFKPLSCNTSICCKVGVTFRVVQFAVM